MVDALAPRLRTDAPWALAALAAGALAAASVVLVPQGPLPALAALAALAVAGVALWRLEWGIVGLLFTLPLDIYGRLVAEPVPVTVFQLVLLVCLASWALRILAEGRRWLRFSVVDAGAGLLVVAGLMSLPASLAPQTTAMSVARVAVLWAFALMYANIVRDERLLARVVRTLSLTGVGIGLLALAQYFVPGFSFGSVAQVRGLGGG
ncbi:MAG: hypothetical protein C0418_03025, partial [Coriobacteriaceae bacterium]|nr:hypothetical protein [Coriobacteriaceae bacterium]